jgi:hypothetical protein
MSFLKLELSVTPGGMRKTKLMIANNSNSIVSFFTQDLKDDINALKYGQNMILEVINTSDNVINQLPLYDYVKVIDDEGVSHLINENGFLDEDNEEDNEDEDDDDEDFCDNYTVEINTEPILNWLREINFIGSTNTSVLLDGDKEYNVNTIYDLD